MPAWKRLERKTSPFTGKGAPRGGSNIHWVEPELVAEIEFAGFTGDGSVRQASFKGLREDKPAKAVEAEAPAPVEEVELARPRPQAGEQGERQGLGAGRGDLQSRQAAVARRRRRQAGDQVGAGRILRGGRPWMLEHVKGRPCSVIRMPDGIDGEKFFQRHSGKGVSALIDDVTVSGDRSRI
jgi:bifunctional non-homologous end joining protein LigD